MLLKKVLSLALFFIVCTSFAAYAQQENETGKAYLKKIIKERFYKNLLERKQLRKANNNNKLYISFTSQGLHRRYILVKPRQINSSRPIPLLIVLHGSYGSGNKMQRTLGFDKYVDTYNFAVAYPDAYIPEGQTKTLRWNDGRGTLDSSKLGVDDVQAMRDMIKDISQRISLDHNRIFATGASNGGMMSYRLGCEAANLFAGIAPVIGNIALPVARSCSPAKPISLLAINGTDDPFIPFHGGTVCKNTSKLFCEKGEVISSSDSLKKFAKRAGCSLSPDRTMLVPKVQDGTRVERLTFTQCNNGIKLQAYWIHGGGHTWPPHRGQLGDKSGKASQNIDATEVILDFFLK